MKITTKLKEKLQVAKILGYERIVTVIGAVKATTYCNYWDIDYLLEQEIGEQITCYPTQRKGMWRGWSNTRQQTEKDVNYSVLFKRFHTFDFEREIDRDITI